MEVIKKSTLGEVFAKRVSFQAGKGEKGREEREREREREREILIPQFPLGQTWTA